jgi:DNA polymerase-3 subunit alpha
VSCSKQVPKEHGSSKSLQEAAEEVAAIKIFSDKHPEVWKDACNLQGIFNIYGQHAAGVVVAGKPIVDHAVVETRKGGVLCNWDKSCVEDFGLVKLDVLGLSNLDVLKLAQNYIKERHGVVVDYEDVPLDDSEILKAFGEGKTNAIFQFESGGMKSLLKSIADFEPQSFNDLCAVPALYRPGPMDAGLLDQYVNVKQGNVSIEYPHSICEPALSETYGVMVFQEQVMQIARDLSGFSMSEADILRKAIGKKDAKLMATMGEKFVEGAQASGMSEYAAEALWEDILGFAAYSFNKSHSVAYSVISYLTMWLKIKYPAEFFAASMTVLQEEKLPGLVRDCSRAGILIVPPDINLSTDRFEIGFDKARDCQTLVIPFQRLKGLSQKANAAISDARAKRLKEKGCEFFESKQEFLDYVAKRVCNIRVQNALDLVGAFAAIESQTPAMHPDRVKDQKILLPNLIAEDVKADRDIDLSPFIKKQLLGIAIEADSCCPTYKSMTVVKPAFSAKSSPKFMVITDAPNYGEQESGVMLKGKGSADIILALKEAGLKTRNGYFTALSKMQKPKGEKQLPQQMVIDFGPILLKEIEILKPPVIVALGAAAARFLLPDLKGGWEQIANTTHYDSKRDCTIVIGCNPAMLYFNPEHINILVEAFETTRGMIE